MAVCLLVVLALLGLRFSLHSTSPEAEGPAGVLLISLDTTRRDHLSCYGYTRETTPEIDALARDSLLFSKAVAVSNWTLPTHASMLTGLFPSSHGAHWADLTDPDHPPASPATPILSSCDTVTEILQAAGYRTAAVVANAWLNEDMNFDQGFDVFDNRPGTPPAPYRQAEEITEAAIEWLEQRSYKPFFLFLNYMDPHVPFNPPPPFNTRFREGNRTGTPQRSWGNQFWAETRARVLGSERPLAERTHRLFVDHYDQEIAYLDSEIGRLLDWLRENRLYDGTLIVLTADHGEALGEHLILGHGLGLYEPEVAVPMIVKLPNQERTGVEDVGVQHTDILPTILDVLSLETPPGVQGESMLTASERPLYVEEYVDPENAKRALASDPGGWKRFGRRQWALYRGSLKLIEYSDGTHELFDLREDPGELHDLSDSRDNVGGQMQADLGILRDLITPIAAGPSGSSPFSTQRIRRLKDLGYLQ